jgi:hypothetical protein
VRLRLRELLGPRLPLPWPLPLPLPLRPAGEERRGEEPTREWGETGHSRRRAISAKSHLQEASHKGIAFQAPKGTNPLQQADGGAYLAAGEGEGEGEGEGGGEGPSRASTHLRPERDAFPVDGRMDAWAHGRMDASISARHWHWQAITASRGTGRPPAKDFAIQTSEFGVLSSEF